MLNAAIPLQGRRPERKNYAAEMMAALQIRNAQAHAQAAQAQMAERAAMRERLIAAGGDPRAAAQGLLEGGHMDAGMKLLESIGKLDKQSLEMEGKRLERADRLLSRATPETWARVRPRIMELDSDTGDLPEVVDQQWLDNARRSLLTAKERVDLANSDRRFDLSKAQFEETKRANRAREAQKSGIALSFDPESGAFSFTSGNRPAMQLDKTVKRETQQGAITAAEQLADLDRIASQFDPAFLTYKGQGQSALAGVMDKANIASPEQKSVLRRKRVFKQGVQQFFNAYKKFVTGAAASEREIEDIKDSIINMDLGPTEFEAALGEMRAKVARSLRIKNRLLREGLRVGSKRFSDAHDKLWAGGADDAWLERGEELEQMGLSDDEIMQTLEDEGYKVM